MTKYWIVVASRDHVQRGVEAGFCQACHGKSSPLKRMNKGDWVVYYSSKMVFGENERCQKFTAIGRIEDDLVYQHDMGNGFVPYRRNVEFQACQETEIAPLIDSLSFIRDKKRWGGPFRYGLLQIPEQDFQLIAEQMLPERLPVAAQHLLENNR
ncbi:MAG: EVE domain-containing protein [Candidatus Promineifilaceae bacterium]